MFQETGVPTSISPHGVNQVLKAVLVGKEIPVGLLSKRVAFDNLLVSFTVTSYHHIQTRAVINHRERADTRIVRS